MKNISTGFGLCVLGLGIAAWPVLDRLAPTANASAVTSAASAVSTAATAQTGPTIVWMGVSSVNGSVFKDNLYRLWSDGRIEMRCTYYTDNCSDTPGSSEWREVAPPPGGSGFACRADLDGNRTVDGADLGMILANWGQQPPCEPEATFPCMTIPGGTLAPLVP